MIVGIVLGILYLLTARGIANRKKWAKILDIVLSILTMIFNVPYGTALGVILLIFLFSDEVEKCFAEDESVPVA